VESATSVSAGAARLLRLNHATTAANGIIAASMATTSLIAGSGGVHQPQRWKREPLIASTRASTSHASAIVAITSSAGFAMAARAGVMPADCRGSSEN